MRILAATVAAAGVALLAAPPAAAQTGDTLHLAVGSPQVNGAIYRPHKGRVVRLVIDGARVDTTADWLNTLVIGDSAGRTVHRWHTGGWSQGPSGTRNRFDLWSTFDGRTLALLGWRFEGGSGFRASLAIDGAAVKGTVKPPAAAEPNAVDFTLPEAGFASGAADLIPYAVGLRDGLTMTLPLWTPPGQKMERQIWTVVGREPFAYEGRRVPSWVMDHFTPGNPKAQGRIWFIDEPPYVVRWELYQQDGKVVRMEGLKGE